MNKELEYSIAKFIATGKFEPGLLLKVAKVSQWELEGRFPLHVDKVREFVVRTALYWWDLERTFRPSRMEMESGSYTCPKCRESMVQQIYKFKGKLLRCPGCHWSIRFSDLWEEGRERKPRETIENPL